MDRREVIQLFAGFLSSFPRRLLAIDTAAGDPPAEAIFARAKAAWRDRREVPFVTFALRERYTWRSRVHDNWWQAAYRASDGALALTRTIVAEDEAQRLRGSAIALDLHWHHGNMRADTLDTNAAADAFPVLDPMIEPTASFGMLRRERRAELVGDDVRAQPVAERATPSPLPSPGALPTPGTLRELAHVEATVRDYAIANAGHERIGETDAYHLILTPLRAPSLYRLRDLWVDASTSQTLRLAMQGLFDGKPYDDARWVVGYVNFDGLGYVQQIRTEDTLRFGADRFVSGLQFDFVGYAFPNDIPALNFERFL
jgi:hypothetical protein